VIFISDAFAQPFAGVVRDTEGNIYGSTFYGGNSACMFGCGTVFQVTPSGTETQLFLFSGATGTWPEGVIRDAKGKIYGATGYSATRDVMRSGAGWYLRSRRSSAHPQLAVVGRTLPPFHDLPSLARRFRHSRSPIQSRIAAE
jgi:hypothetical protein